MGNYIKMLCIYDIIIRKTAENSGVFAVFFEFPRKKSGMMLFTQDSSLKHRYHREAAIHGGGSEHGMTITHNNEEFHVFASDNRYGGLKELTLKNTKASCVIDVKGQDYILEIAKLPLDY